MALKNFYPEKPMVQFRRTTVEMGAVIERIKSSGYPVEVKRATYMIFRNESLNGQKGVNNNYVGAQADGARWPARFDADIYGVVQKIDSGSNMRLFLAFNSFTDSVDFLLDRLQTRGLYVGGEVTVKNKVKTLVYAMPDIAHYSQGYKKSWVRGDPDAVATPADIARDLSMYTQAIKIFV